MNDSEEIKNMVSPEEFENILSAKYCVLMAFDQSSMCKLTNISPQLEKYIYQEIINTVYDKFGTLTKDETPPVVAYLTFRIFKNRSFDKVEYAKSLAEKEDSDATWVTYFSAVNKLESELTENIEIAVNMFKEDPRFKLLRGD